MKKINMKKTSVVSVTLLSLAANFALAAGGDDQGQDNQVGIYQVHDHEPWHDQGAVSAPEIDPGQAMGALLLLGGTVAILRGYRRNKK
jgi:hypothetical protein